MNSKDFEITSEVSRIKKKIDERYGDDELIPLASQIFYHGFINPETAAKAVKVFINEFFEEKLVEDYFIDFVCVLPEETITDLEILEILIDSCPKEIILSLAIVLPENSLLEATTIPKLQDKVDKKHRRELSDLIIDTALKNKISKNRPSPDSIKGKKSKKTVRKSTLS